MSNNKIGEGVASQARPPAYALTALTQETANVSAATEGTRNDTLNKAAFNLARFIATGELDEMQIRDSLTTAARKAGLAHTEIIATLNSALSSRSADPDGWEDFLNPPKQSREPRADRPRTKSSEGVVQPGQSTRQLVVTRGSQVKAKKLEWWDSGLILKSAINLLAAREGKGKSTVASSWAARETRNGGTVLWVGTEESREHAVVPRLIAAGADMDRVIFIDVETDLGTGALMFPLDLNRFEQVIREHNVTMIDLDPAKAVVPPGFSGNDDIAVRQYLEPLAALADRCKVTIVGLAHFGKRTGTDSGQLMLGSVAWSQVARCVLSIAEDPDTGTRVLTNTKSNYAGTDRSVEFRIVGTTIDTDDGPTEIGSVEWLGDTTLDARDLLGGNDDDDHGERTAAEHWLEDYLTENGPTPSREIKNAAAKERISDRTLKRAKKNTGVLDASTGFPRTSTWYLPSQANLVGTGGPTGGVVHSGGPTGPTEPDQAKQDGPTEANLQWGHDSKSGPTGAEAPPTPLTARKQELSHRRIIRVMGKEVPRCIHCGKGVMAGQGDTHLGCASKQRDTA